MSDPSHEQHIENKEPVTPDFPSRLTPVVISSIDENAFGTVDPVWTMRQDLSTPQPTSVWQATIVAPPALAQSEGSFSLNVVFSSEHAVKNSVPLIDFPLNIATPFAEFGGTPILIEQLRSLSDFMACQRSVSISTVVDWMNETDQFSLLNELDWAFESSSCVLDPMPDFFDDQETALLGIGGRPLYSSTSRKQAMSLLVPVRLRGLILPLVAANWEEALQALTKMSDHRLMTSLVKLVVPTTSSVLEDLLCDSEIYFLQETVSCINQLFNPSMSCDQLVAGPFVSALFALAYCSTFRVPACGQMSSLRAAVLIGLKDEERVGNLISRYLHVSHQNPFAVCLLGLACPSLAATPTVHKCVDFVRDLCNQQRGNAWLVRNFIDKIFSKTTTTSCVMTCYYCGKPLHSTDSSSLITRCPHRGCHRALPSCCICLEPITLGGDASSVWCSTCRHGGHKKHVLDWFEKFDDCPVAGCHCQCANIDGS